MNFTGEYLGECDWPRCGSGVVHDCPVPPIGWQPHVMVLFVGGHRHAEVNAVNLVQVARFQLALPGDPPPAAKHVQWALPESYVSLVSAETYMLRQFDVAYMESGQLAHYQLPAYVLAEVTPPEYAQAVSLACMSYTARTLGQRTTPLQPNGATPTEGRPDRGSHDPGQVQA